MLWNHMIRFWTFIILFNLVKIPDNFALNYRTNREKWPNGVVPYKLHTSLTLADMAEVKKGFEDYHKRTCIKFVPWKKGDPDFVSIEVDNSHCILSSSCKAGGSQFVRFGGNCRNMGYVIFGLGHALCFTNENLRSDRDNYLKVYANCTPIPEIDTTSKGVGIYDYSSVFHNSGCNSCRTGWPQNVTLKSCGRTTHSQSLSVFDVDGINAVYNCQGCNRHRWQPLELLAHEDKINMHSFSDNLHDSKPLYPCRALLQRGKVYMGWYDVQNKSCHIFASLKPYELKDNVEILTIPGGLKAQCSVYKLVSKEKALKTDAIVGGASFFDRRWKGFVAIRFTNITEDMREARIGTAWVLESGGYNDSDDIDKGFSGIRVGFANQNVEDYKVLTCSLDTSCMLEELYFEKMKDKKR